MAFSFFGGIHPRENKWYTCDREIEEFPEPDILVVPMSQHIGAPAVPVVKKGDTVMVGTLPVHVFYTPGHTPGGVTLLVEGQNVLFTGDTLFQGSMGRTDLGGRRRLYRGRGRHALCGLERALLRLFRP